MIGPYKISTIKKSPVQFILFSIFVLIVTVCWMPTAEAAHRYSRFARPGQHIRDLPSGHITVLVGKSSYRYNRGIFYRPARRGYVVVRAPIGARVRSLPAGFISFSIGVRRYFYVNSAYYLWDPPTREYIVVNAPDGAEEAVRREAAEVVQELFVYPAQGQSDELVRQDRYECYVWASEQSGFDPSSAADNPDGHSDYNRAFSACLEGRGYTVR